MREVGVIPNDTERLDFVIQRDVRFALRDGENPTCIVSGSRYTAPTSREAIDIAISGERAYETLNKNERKSA